MARRGVLKEGHMPSWRGSPWSEIRGWYQELGWPQLQPLIDIVSSVEECGGAERLVATTSMHDLWVTRRTPEGPASRVDLITVRAFTSVRPLPEGEMVIEHTSHSGQVEVIARPPADAVPLFWRFVREKWGIEPWRWDTYDDAQRHVLRLASQEADLYETTWRGKIGDVGGSREVAAREVARAQAAVAELLRTGLIQLRVREGPAERVATGADLALVFGSGAAWHEPGGGPRVGLALTPAGRSWYYSGSDQTM